MTTDPTPDAVLAAAAARGYPPLSLTPGLRRVERGEEAWRRFVAGASEATRALALRRLAARKKGRRS